MNKKIKIIDLAINIANEEWNKVPSRISFEGDDFIFDKEEKKYKQVDEDYICLCFPTYKLNAEVEILEDNTEEIEELPDYNYSIKENRDKINEIIRYIKRKDKNK